MPSTMSPARPATPPRHDARGCSDPRRLVGESRPASLPSASSIARGTRPAFRRVRRPARARPNCTNAIGRSGRRSSSGRRRPALCASIRSSSVPPSTGYSPGDEVIEQHADGVDVALHRGRLAVEQFRRHVRRGVPTMSRGRRSPTAGVVAGAEVHQHDLPGLVAHHVLRLHVAVHVARGVDGGERPADVLARHRPPRGGSAGRRDRRTPASVSPETSSMHSPTRLPWASMPNTWTTLACCTFASARPSRSRRWRSRSSVDLRVEDLDRDVPLELRIPGAVDAARSCRSPSSRTRR